MPKTVAAFLSVLLLASASAQTIVYNPTFGGSARSDLDLGGHALVNAAVNGPSRLVQLNASGGLPALDGSLLGGLLWSQVHGTPATLAGYGIADPVALTSGSYADPSWISSLAWGKVSGRPTTLAGYGIADPVALTSGSYANPSWIASLAWSKVSGKPTTLGGYGITDSLATLAGTNTFTASQAIQLASGKSSLSIGSTASGGNLVLEGSMDASSVSPGLGFDPWIHQGSSAARQNDLQLDAGFNGNIYLGQSSTNSNAHNRVVVGMGNADDGSTPLQVNGPVRLGSAAPASASASGIAGQVTWDGGYVYVCTAANTWKRAALSSW